MLRSFGERVAWGPLGIPLLVSLGVLIVSLRCGMSESLLKSWEMGGWDCHSLEGPLSSINLQHAKQELQPGNSTGGCWPSGSRSDFGRRNFLEWGGGGGRSQAHLASNNEMYFYKQLRDPKHVTQVPGFHSSIGVSWFSWCCPLVS